MLSRLCPNCQKQIFYCNKYVMLRAENQNSNCKKCVGLSIKTPDILTRNCPKCNKILNYKRKSDRNVAEKKGSICDFCLKSSEEYKKRTSETTKRINLERPRKSNQEYWMEKYGAEETSKRIENWKKQTSISCSGEKNGMYGKPSPNGSGNGWKGWYKNYFFRSVLELSYIINELEKTNKNWQSGEKISIIYVNYDGKHRTYRPDFIIDDKIMIECKPKRLINSPLVKLKTEAAIKYCEENNMEYVLLTPKIIDFSVLNNLVENKIVILTKSSYKKFQEYKEKRN